MKVRLILAQKQPDLSIVIPAYCEERRIGQTLEELAMFLKKDDFFKSKNVEVIVVAADAPDNTRHIVSDKQKLFKSFKLLLPGPRVGKGRDVQFGMLQASGKFVAFMDADLATPLHHLKDFYDQCSSGTDIVVGTRNLLAYRSSLPRGLFASFGNLLYRLGGGIWIEDTQCGFKMFRADASKLCFSKLGVVGWGFDIEILAIAKANKLTVEPMRVNDWRHMPYSTYTEGPLRITSRSIRDFGYVTGRRLLGTYRK